MKAVFQPVCCAMHHNVALYSLPNVTIMTDFLTVSKWFWEDFWPGVRDKVMSRPLIVKPAHRQGFKSERMTEDVIIVLV